MNKNKILIKRATAKDFYLLPDIETAAAKLFKEFISAWNFESSILLEFLIFSNFESKLLLTRPFTFSVKYRVNKLPSRVGKIEYIKTFDKLMDIWFLLIWWVTQIYKSIYEWNFKHNLIL